MSKLKDLTGQKFGKLTVIERAENDKRGNVQWLCECECGNKKVVRGYQLTSNKTKSCGCLVGHNNGVHYKTRTRPVDLECDEVVKQWLESEVRE